MKKGYLLFYTMIVLFLLGTTGILLKDIFLSQHNLVDDFIERDKEMIIDWAEK
jgi:hypothetical protein